MHEEDRRTTRKLCIIGQDPGFEETRDGKCYIVRAEAEVPAEELLPGPTGYRVKVIDYDVSTDTLYVPAKIPGPDEPDLFHAADDDTLKQDPRLHAQNVYAIVMRTLARFEKALGRRVEWGCDGHQLHVVPHAFSEANAFYSRSDRALFFGYFKGVHGNTIFTSLSHDVIAHETAHAILDGLRSRFFEPSSPDQAAFHEGFADVVAMLSMFSLPEMVKGMLDHATDKKIAAKGAAAPAGEEPHALIDARLLEPEWLKKSAVFGLAEQMGTELSQRRGNALRRSVDLDPATAQADSEEFQEEHRRGELIVAAMLNAFLYIWTVRIGKIGAIRDGKKDRSVVVEAGARVADHLLTMAIRAIDYCPPVDLTFGDYLSALLTVDREVVPDDGRYGYRDALIAEFARFGIAPSAGTADGTWKRWDARRNPLTYSRTHFESLLRDKQEVFRFLWENRRRLDLDERGYVEIESVRTCVRTAPDGFMLRETVAEYVQMLTLSVEEFRKDLRVRIPDSVPRSERFRMYGGGTLIFDEYGQLKYHIAKGFAKSRQDRKRQADRAEHLWKLGMLQAPDDAAARIADLHLARAGLKGALDAAG